MAYVNNQTSLVSNEMDFFNKFAEDITNASEFNHIKLVNNTIEQAVQRITFKIMDILELNIFNRSSNISSLSYKLSYNLYNNSVDIDGLTLSNKGSSNTDTIINRKINYLIIDNPTSILFCLNSCGKTTFFNNSAVNCSILLFKNDLATGGNVIKDKNINSINSFILSDNTAKYYNALNFTHTDDNISICNKILVDESNRYIASLDNIYDCSYVTKNSLITVNNKKCFAIDEHTLIACE